MTGTSNNNNDNYIDEKIRHIKSLPPCQHCFYNVVRTSGTCERHRYLTWFLGGTFCVDDETKVITLYRLIQEGVITLDDLILDEFPLRVMVKEIMDNDISNQFSSLKISTS